MEWFDQLGVALGLATLAGLNLYLTVALLGLIIRFQWINLAGPYENLAILGNPWIIGVATALFVIEFVADKVSWVDSTWDAVHTIIRPAGGILLTLTALGDMDPIMTVIAGLCAGTAALTTHGTKATTRLMMNFSPEPISNTVTSLTEDGLVVGGIGLIAFAPMIALFAFVLLIIACIILMRWMWKKVTSIRSRKQVIRV